MLFSLWKEYFMYRQRCVWWWGHISHKKSKCSFFLFFKIKNMSLFIQLNCCEHKRKYARCEIKDFSVLVPLLCHKDLKSFSGLFLLEIYSWYTLKGNIKYTKLLKIRIPMNVGVHKSLLQGRADVFCYSKDCPGECCFSDFFITFNGQHRQVWMNF